MHARAAVVSAVVLMGAACSSSVTHPRGTTSSDAGGTEADSALDGSPSTDAGTSPDGSVAAPDSSVAFDAGFDAGRESCAPSSCSALGKDCGTTPDGCGGTLDCGACTKPGDTCGGGGMANVCGQGPCVPKQCGSACGTISDGCGSTLDCGGCTQPDQTCGGGGIPNVCGCTPTTCTALGKNCGSLPDGCGGTLSCGTCTHPGDTCGGGGTPNVCGQGPCVPKTCAGIGATCGSASDGCGGTISCGTCSSPQTCVSNTCQYACGSCIGKVCGTDSCGHSCGTCPTGEGCLGATCDKSCGYQFTATGASSSTLTMNGATDGGRCSPSGTPGSYVTASEVVQDVTKGINYQAQLTITWGSTLPTPNTTYTLDSTSAISIFFGTSVGGGAPADIQGSHWSSQSGAQAMLQVGAFSPVSGGSYSFTIQPGSVLTGASSVQISGTMSGVFP